MPLGVKHVDQVGFAPRVRHYERDGRGLDAQATLQRVGAIVLDVSGYSGCKGRGTLLGCLLVCRVEWLVHLTLPQCR